MAIASSEAARRWSIPPIASTSSKCWIESYPFVAFYRDADLLIFDAMYSLADQISVKEDWGHSSNMIAVELAQLAGVKHLVLFHHEPIDDDRTIEHDPGRDPPLRGNQPPGHGKVDDHLRL